MARVTDEQQLQAEGLQDLKDLVCEGHPRVVAVGDRTGLCVRIIAPNKATWQLRYRIAGVAHWLTLGKFSDFGLREARKRATKERARIVDGVDPVAEKRRAKREAQATRAALRAAKTVHDLSRDYMDRAGPDLAASTKSDREWMLKQDILPRIGDLRLEEIDGADIVRMVESIGRRSPVMARKAFSVTSVLFGHGIGKHLCKSNPCAGVSVRAILGKKQPVRETKALTEDELRLLLPQADGMGRSNGLALRIMLATAVRKIEIRKAAWTDIDFDAATWRIPPENAKNGKLLVIPMAPAVVQWFRELQERACGCPWVLPGQNRRDPVSDSTLNAALDRLAVLGVRRFTVHDLRRSARSLLGTLGVDVIVAEKFLNHSLGGLVDIYDRGSYLSQRRRAAELLAEFLVACEEGRPLKVIPLRREAA
jgi:integrase